MRKIIAFAIVCFASLFAILLIAGKNQLTPSVKNQTPPKFQAEEKLATQKPAIRPQQNLATPIKIGGQATALLNTSEQADTHYGAAKIPPDAVKKENQSEVSAILQNLEPEEIANQFFDQQFKNKIEDFNYEKFKPAILTENLRVIYKTDKQLSENYLKNFKKILDDSAVNIQNQLKNPNLSDSSQLISFYQQTIESLYQLPVPENLLEIHKKELALLETQKRIFELTQNYEQDPLQAMLAFQAQENLNAEFMELNKTINQFISKNQLTI